MQEKNKRKWLTYNCVLFVHTYMYISLEPSPSPSGAVWSPLLFIIIIWKVLAISVVFCNTRCFKILWTNNMVSKDAPYYLYSSYVCIKVEHQGNSLKKIEGLVSCSPYIFDYLFIGMPSCSVYIERWTNMWSHCVLVFHFSC